MSSTLPPLLFGCSAIIVTQSPMTPMIVSAAEPIRKLGGRECVTADVGERAAAGPLMSGAQTSHGDFRVKGVRIRGENQLTHLRLHAGRLGGVHLVGVDCERRQRLFAIDVLARGDRRQHHLLAARLAQCMTSIPGHLFVSLPGPATLLGSCVAASASAPGRSECAFGARSERHSDVARENPSAAAFVAASSLISAIRISFQLVRQVEQTPWRRRMRAPCL
jgi:hypothetical protein